MLGKIEAVFVPVPGT